MISLVLIINIFLVNSFSYRDIEDGLESDAFGLCEACRGRR